eukprot:3428685-Amphidinium_carterae.1
MGPKKKSRGDARKRLVLLLKTYSRNGFASSVALHKVCHLEGEAADVCHFPFGRTFERARATWDALPLSRKRLGMQLYHISATFLAATYFAFKFC